MPLWVPEIPQSLVDAKGDQIVGSADNTVIRKAVGTDGQVWTADAASAGGIKWATPINPGFDVAMQNLLATSLEPAAAATAGSLGANGDIQLAKLWLPTPVTISNLIVVVTTAGGTLTSGQCFGAIFDSAGTLIASTATQHTAWQTTGTKTMALTADGAQSMTRGGPGVFVIGAVWANGTTRPQMQAAFPAGGFSAFNVGLSGLAMRSATKNAAQTTVPTSITTGNTSGIIFLMALS